MKILILQDYLRCGGTEHQSLFLASYFNNKGHDVTIITFRPGGILFSKLNKEKIKYINLQVFDTKIDSFAPGICNIIQKESSDIILCMGRVANNYGGYIQKKFPDTVIICTIRTGKILSVSNGRSFGSVRSIIANTGWWSIDLVRRGIPNNKITVINNSLSRSWKFVPNKFYKNLIRKNFNLIIDTCIFINVASFQLKKRQDRLIEYCHKLPFDIKWQLWLIGKGFSMSLCKAIAFLRNIGKQVYFFDYQSDLLPFYLAADISLSASIQDSQPNFIVESQSLGLPVIAYDYRGVKDCLSDNKTGLLVKYGQDRLFISAMRDLIKDQERRKSMSYLSCQWVNKYFDLNDQANKYLKLFQHLRDKLN